MMKRKENFRIGRKNLTVVVLAFVLVISAMLTACGSSAIETTPEAKEEVVVDKVEEKTAEEVEQAETVEEVVESTEEVAGPQSVAQWAKTFDTEEPQLTIWNDITKEGTIVENGQRCILKDGDVLVVCMQETESNMEYLSPVKCESYGSERYKVLEFTQEFSEDTLYEFIITVAGVEYPFSVTLISENAASTVSDSETAETTQTTEVSGKEWVSSLEYAEPKLVVWNDETGTKEVIELGGKYVMQQGDILGMYCPEDYFLFNVFPIEFAGELAIVSDVVVIEYNLPSESQEINLEVELMNPQQEFVTYNYVITTP